MIMDGGSIQSDLQALQKLYGLVKNGENGMSNIASVMLDTHARLLLKNMLDKETQRILKTHAEIIASQVDESKMLSLTQLQQPDESSNKKLIPSPNSATALGIYTPPQFTWNVGAIGAEYRKKHCRVCQKCTVKKIEAVDDTKFSQNSNGVINLQNQKNNQSDCSVWNGKQETESMLSNKTDDSNIEGKQTGSFPSNLRGEVDCLSTEASKAIEQIELCITALQLSADLHLFEENSIKIQNVVPDTKRVGSTLCQQYGAVPCADMLQNAESFVRSRTNLDPEDYPPLKVPCLSLTQSSSMPVQPTDNSPQLRTYPFIGPAFRSDVSDSKLEASLEEDRSPFQKTSRVHGQNVRAIVDRIESRNWRMSQIPFAGNFSVVAQDQNGVSNRSPATTFSSAASKMGNPDKIFTAIKDKSNFSDPINSGNVDSGQSVILNLGTRARNHPPNSSREAVIHEKPTQLLIKHKDRVANNRKYVTASSRQEEPEGTASSSSYSSNWESSYGGDSESEYSSSQRLRYATPSTSSESVGAPSPLSHRNRSSMNDSEDEVYSSTSGNELTTNTSGKSYVYTSYDKSTCGPACLSMDSTSGEAGPSRIHKPGKRNGTWKRLKNKLAVIFHHHHHHHHHHNAEDGDKDFRRIVREMSLKNHKGKSFRSREVEAYGEKAVEKMKKSDKNQFQGLMKGLMRHVKPCTKTKPVKDHIGQLAKGKHGMHKVLKKSHWWLLLKQHRGAKLPKKTHVNLGLGKKKTGLKALARLK